VKSRYPVRVTALRGLVCVLLVAALSACDSAPPGSTSTGGTAGPVTVDVADRPVKLHVPKSYRTGTKAPLVVLLHGYTSNAGVAESYFKLTAESEKHGFLYAMPEGTKNRRGDQFWNATAACCDFYSNGTDDSGYLRQLIDKVTAAYSVDPARVYFIGHSNGGFMALRMACDHATQVTAVVSLAGAATNDPAQCAPKRAVSVLQIHGTADPTIRFDGGTNGGQSYPSAANTVDLWRRLDGCAEAATPAAPKDLERNLPGAETTVTTYQTNCRDGARVELWSIADGSHVPAVGSDFAAVVMDFLLARVAPA
jgi:polyhydroxybutyrate depolymerase